MAFRKYFLGGVIFAFLLGAPTGRAFSLLGPFADWMTPSVGFVQHPAYDLGGPRNLGDEFRWNLPVLTYGFDQEFKDFFGTNGVAVVEDAIGYFNSLQPASQIDLTTRPLEARRIHETARSLDLQNLRSAVMVYLLEQMGLANAPRFAWVNTSTNIAVGVSEEDGPFPEILQRNFDPFNLDPTPFVSGFRFTYQVVSYPPPNWPLPEGNRIAAAIQVNQTRLSPGEVSAGVGAFTTSPDLGMHIGEYIAALTRDDEGGRVYLYHTNNVNMEPLASGVRSHEGGPLIETAARPGVDKIVFQRFDPDTAAITNVFEDRYILDGVLKTQVVERVISAPDILFSAGWHTNEMVVGFDERVIGLAHRTGMKFSHTNATGPGIFYPGVTISFQKLGDLKRDVVVDPVWGPQEESRWGVFNNRTVTPKIFPDGPEYQTGRTLGVELKGNEMVWSLRLIAGVPYAMETSTNLVDWSLKQSFFGSSVLNLTNVVETGGGAEFLRVRRTGP